MVSGISGLHASQVTLEYQAGGAWQPVPLTDRQDGSITGYFGPPNGFPFPAGQSSTTPLRLAIAAGAPAAPGRTERAVAGRAARRATAAV